MNGFFSGALKFAENLAARAALAAVCLLISHTPAGAATVPPEMVNSVFDMANEEYKAGSYENAITLYEGLLSSPGIETADIHYNIGSAFFKLNNYGRAISSYRRALTLAPRNQDIVANLEFVREATLDRIDQPRGAELRRDIFFFHYGLNAAEAETAFFLAYVAAAGLGAAFLASRSRRLKWLSLIALFLAVMFGASLTLRWISSANPTEAVVVVDEADVHTGPGENYIVSFGLHDGAELQISRSEGEWRLIELSDGRRGWIAKAHVETI